MINRDGKRGTGNPDEWRPIWKREKKVVELVWHIREAEAEPNIYEKE